MGVEITGPMNERYGEILTPEALDLLARLHREFDGRRLELLERRQGLRDGGSAGGISKGLRDGGSAGGISDGWTEFGFLAETERVREDPDWRVVDPAPGLVDRRVEITGPTDAKMTINALNSGAKVWMADHEDANTPLWENVIGGQINLKDAAEGKLTFTSPEGKLYEVAEGELPTVVFRPRGWHLSEKHILVDGQRMSGSLVDFGLYLINHRERPYFYLPKMESHLEARLWNDVFVAAQEQLAMARGTIRATVLIETLPAAFEMEEILYELREHSSGLNAGRWDYMFSTIKKMRERGPEFVLPDRNSVTMTVPFLRAYTELLVKTCHKRGAHAIGGMAAFIPSRRDPEVNEVALAKVRDDKTREANDGFDGSWVAHPDLVPVCKKVFDEKLGESPNQLERTRSEVSVTAADLLAIGATPGKRTMEGLRNNISVGIQYLASWLRGTGAVAINNLMEDAATAEISRSQVWQWLHNDVVLDDTGERVSKELVERLAQEVEGDEARALFMEVAVADNFVDFLTLPAYERMP
ncbi:MAG TPA: malate synthase A [Candidatus Limnocylindrales bacterium]|nr:malate synthase A [Candidatus Limnocylindrales bacterium]